MHHRRRGNTTTFQGSIGQNRYGNVGIDPQEVVLEEGMIVRARQWIILDNHGQIESEASAARLVRPFNQEMPQPRMSTSWECSGLVKAWGTVRGARLVTTARRASGDTQLGRATPQRGAYGWTDHNGLQEDTLPAKVNA
jgi:hypothetical protein